MDAHFSIRRLLRKAIRSTSTSPLAGAVWRMALHQQALILTYHRFASAENGFRGDASPATLRAHLAGLRRARCTLMPLAQLLDAMVEGRPLPPRTVVVTVDDGYRDFLASGWPVFREFEVPVTMFLCTGFVDGKLWLWWDRIEAAVKAAGPDARFRLASSPWAAAWRDSEGSATAQAIAIQLERLPTGERERQLDALVATLGVSLPAAPTGPEFGAMTWDEVRQLEAGGVQFGPHTVTHPILSLCDSESVRLELADSWRRVREELRQPVAILAYPNGSSFAWGAREEALCHGVGLQAALTTLPRFVRTASADVNRFAIPRTGAPTDQQEFLQLVTGPEYCRHVLKGWT